MRRIETYSRDQLINLVKELNSNHICGVCPNKNSMCDGLVSLDDCYSYIVNNLIEEVKVNSVMQFNLPTLKNCITLLKAHMSSSTPDDTPLVITPKYYKTIKKYLMMYTDDLRPRFLIDLDNIIYLNKIFIDSKIPQLFINKTDSEKLVNLLMVISILDKQY